MAIVLREKGDEANIEGKEALATLLWKTSVDLDLWCFYIPKGGQAPKKKGMFSKLLGGGASDGGNVGKIGFNCKGNLNRAPHIQLDQDSGVGDVMTGDGFNEENMRFGNLDSIDYALICANIYNKTTNFGQYEGMVAVKAGGQEIDVPLTETSTGSWCAVALIDNTNPMGPKLKNINKTQRTKPAISDFI